MFLQVTEENKNSKNKKVRKINGEKVGWELVNKASCRSLNVVSPNIKCHIGLCLCFYSRRVDKQCTLATRVSNADTGSSTHFAGKLPVPCQSLSRQTLSIQSVCSRWELHFPLLKPIRWEVTLEAIEAKAGNRCWRGCDVVVTHPVATGLRLALTVDSLLGFFFIFPPVRLKGQAGVVRHSQGQPGNLPWPWGKQSGQGHRPSHTQGQRMAVLKDIHSTVSTAT